MKKLYILFLIALSVFILSFKILKFANEYKINANNCLVQFKVNDKHGVQRIGSFSSPEGIIRFDKTNPESSYFKISIDVKSLDSKSNLRDKDLLSAHFFDVKKYPLILFESKKIIFTGKNYEVTGNLTIKDKTKELTLPFTFKNSEIGLYFESDFEIRRLDYGVGDISENSANNVSIKLRIPVTEKNQ